MAKKPAKPRRRLRARRRRARTEWHPPFYALVEWRCPRWIRVAPEVLLQRQSQRVDLLLSLRASITRDAEDRGEVLRSLWKYIPRVGLLEFKSVARLFAQGDLYRLVALGWHWLTRNPTHTPDDLLLVLVVPAVTDALRAELALCTASLAAQEPGYHLATVRGVRLLVAELDVVSESERDDYLRVFSHHPIETEEVVHWLREHTDIPEDAVLSPEEVAKNEPYLTKLAQSIPLRIRLKGVKPEEVLAELPPEDRLAGLTPETIARALSEVDHVLALPDAALRGLSPEYVATLPETAQARIRERLAR